MLHLRKTKRDLDKLITKYSKVRKCPWNFGMVLMDLDSNVMVLRRQKKISALQERQLNKRIQKVDNHLKIVCEFEPRKFQFPKSR